MGYWIPFPLFHFLPFALLPLDLPLTASPLPHISYFQEGPGLGVIMGCKMAGGGGGSAGLVGARGLGNACCNRLPGAALP